MKMLVTVAGLALAGAAMLPGHPTFAESVVSAHAGWYVKKTTYSYPVLTDRLKQAVKNAGMILVTEAGPTEAAKARGIDLPGNRVFGVFRNDYAVRIVKLSVSAMIEAPIRFYVTENPDGTASLSYKTPSFVFEPYLDKGGDALQNVAAELDDVFLRIAAQATRD